MDRLLDKAERFRLLSKDLDRDEIIYMSVFEALGYSQARTQMVSLARALPLATLNPLARASPRTEGAARVQAVLCHAAGLAATDTTSLEPDIRQILSAIPFRLKETQWRLSATRPHNKPLARILAMGTIIAELADRSWWERFTDPFVTLSRTPSRADLAGAINDITAFFMDAPSVGKDRSATLSLNAIIPSLLATSPHRSSLMKHLLLAAQVHPSLPGNRVTRRMESLLLNEPVRRGRGYGLCQLGMLELEQFYCGYASPRCGTCPLWLRNEDRDRPRRRAYNVE